VLDSPVLPHQPLLHGLCLQTRSLSELPRLGYSSSDLEESLERPGVVPKWATTVGADDSEGSISETESTRMNRLGVRCLLPKLENSLSMASSLSSATMSTVKSWSLFPALKDPVARNAFMARPTGGPDLTQAGGTILKVQVVVCLVGPEAA